MTKNSKVMMALSVLLTLAAAPALATTPSSGLQDESEGGSCKRTYTGTSTRANASDSGSKRKSESHTSGDSHGVKAGDHGSHAPASE